MPHVQGLKLSNQRREAYLRSKRICHGPGDAERTQHASLAPPEESTVRAAVAALRSARAAGSSEHIQALRSLRQMLSAGPGWIGQATSATQLQRLPARLALAALQAVGLAGVTALKTLRGSCARVFAADDATAEYAREAGAVPLLLQALQVNA